MREGRGSRCRVFMFRVAFKQPGLVLQVQGEAGFLLVRERVN